MGCYSIGRFCDKDINLDTFGNLSRYQMSIIFSGVIACKEYLQAGNLDQEHGSTENMACWIRSNADGRDGVCCMIIYSFDLRKSVKMVFLKNRQAGMSDLRKPRQPVHCPE